MVNNIKIVHKLALLAALLASDTAIPAGLAQAAQGKDKTVVKSSVISPVAHPAPISVTPPSLPTRDLRKPGADNFYRALWGIEDVHVRETASGSLIRFSYRVVDAAKAKILNSAKLNPLLVDASSGEKLEVPETENAGKLRQVADPQNGREYWMVFLNNSRIVRPGSRVNIVVGTFRAEGLVVEPSMSTIAAKKP